MTRTVCFDTAAALADRRFRRKLTKYEGMDFVFLLGFAGSECRDPAFIPAKKMEDLALDLGWTGKAGEAQKEKRLAKWSAPGIELIEMQEDGGIQINYLLDQEFEEEEMQPVQARPAHPNGSSGANGSNGTLSGALNGNGTSPNGTKPSGTNGTSGTEKRGSGERRQQNRRYAENSAAERSRKSYWDRKHQENGSDSQENGGDSQENGGDSLPAEEFENLTAETENLTLSASKPHASGDENGANPAKNLTLSREVLPAPAQDVKDVVGEFKNSLSSDNVSDVPREKNLTQNLTAKNLTFGGKNLTQVPRGKPAAPPPRPKNAIHPEQVHLVRERDVKDVIKGTGDDPAKWKAQWVALWNHCYSHDKLQCWDEGVVYGYHRSKVSPGSGPGSVRVAATLTRGTILWLLIHAGTPYVPKSKGDAPPAEAADPEEQARVHQEIMDIKAGWAAEEQSRLTGITPLEEPSEFEESPRYEEEEE